MKQVIFDHDDLQLQLIDVLYFKDSSTGMRTRARPFCALSLRLDGDTNIEMNGRVIHLAARDLSLFPANISYLRRAKNDEMIVFHFNITNSVLYEIEVMHGVRYDELLPLFREALDEWRVRAPGYRYRASALLYKVFAIIRAELGPKSERLSQPIAAAVRHISENYSDSSLSVESLAQSVHMSDTWFRKHFRQETGVAPKKYITDLRLEHAQSLLNAGYDTVAAVAEKVGFRDAKNFSTAYKKRFGYSPSSQSDIF